MLQKLITTILLLLIFSTIYSQDADKEVKKLLNVNEIVWDEYNQDGVLKARNNKTGKWGMYQYAYDGKRPKTLVTMKYDSLGFYDFSSSYTIVKNKNKYGIILSPWSSDNARRSVRCIYEQIKYVESGNGMLAAKGNNLWGYIDYKTGDTLIPFLHSSQTELPPPNNMFFEYPMQTYPEELLKIMSDPLSITEINLSRLKLTYLPDAIGLCKNAKTANLQNNNLKELPESFFELTQLEALYLGGNPQFTEFTADFGKLKNLKLLYVNKIRGSGSYMSTRSNLTFSPELGQLANLEELGIGGNFNSNNDIPEFIYSLPNLSFLDLDGSLGRSYSNISFEKMQCKDSLTFLRIGIIKDFNKMNAGLKNFSNLSSVHIHTYENTSRPLWINDLAKLDFVKIIYYVPSKDKDGYYSGETAVEISGGWNDEILSDKLRKEAIKNWDEFVISLDK